MNTHRTPVPTRRVTLATLATTAAALLLVGATTMAAAPAYAVEATVDLGDASSFAVLANSTVTNTGQSVISGDVGVSPGTAVTGFPTGNIINGTLHIAGGVAGNAQSALTTAYNDAAGRAGANVTGQDLGTLGS